MLKNDNGLDKTSKTHDDYKGKPGKKPYDEVRELDRNELKIGYVPLPHSTEYSKTYYNHEIPQNI